MNRVTAITIATRLVIGFAAGSSAAFRRAVIRLQHLRDAIQRLTSAIATPSFSVLLVESGMWSRYTVEEGSIGFEAHTDAPPAGGPVVITGNAVLAAIGEHRLTSEEAIHRGLIVVEGQPTLIQVLLAALDKGSGEVPRSDGLCLRACWYPAE